MTAPPDGDPWKLQLDELQRAYVAGIDPRSQSGFRGSPERWERLRRPILAAIDRHGTFLDVGCANGHLMTCLERWGQEDGWELDLSGVDISSALVELARRQLPPRFAGRLHVADVRSWKPRQRYDFVRTELVYAPDENAQRRLVEHLLANVVAPGGRLIVCAYASKRRLARLPLTDVANLLKTWAYEPEGTSSGADLDGTTLTSVAWLTAPLHAAPLGAPSGPPT